MKFCRIILFLLLLAPAALTAQTFPYTDSVSKKAVESIEYISASIISDSFSPMTHYSEGDMLCSAVPAAFSVGEINSSPDIKGDNFRGAAFGAGAGYALSDELMAYIVIAGMKMKGDMKMETYSAAFGTLGNSADYSLFNMSAGAGYEIFSSRYVSVPVYLGLNAQYFNVSFDTDPVTWTQVITYTVEGSTSGDGFLYGVSGGAAVSLRLFERIMITPYYLYLRNFNSAKMKADLTLSNGALAVKESSSFDIDPVSGGMLGLNLGYKDDSGFSFSVALGSLISTLAGYGSQAADNGIEMKSVVMIFSYSYGSE